MTGSEATVGAWPGHPLAGRGGLEVDYGLMLEQVELGSDGLSSANDGARAEQRPGPRCVHERLVGLAKRDAAVDVERGDWLLLGQESAVWEVMGFGSYFEYLERLFGYSPRQASERLRVARTLEELPAMKAALQRGEFTFSAMRELTRVATPDTELAWLRAALGKNMREIEQLISGRERGDDPDTPPNPRVTRHVLRYEVSAETKSILAEARSRLTRDAGHHLTDDEVLTLLARAVLRPASAPDGEAGSQHSSYQIHLTVCEACGAATQRGGGVDVPVGPEVVERACCDATVLRETESELEPVPVPAESVPEPAGDEESQTDDPRGSGRPAESPRGSAMAAIGALPRPRQAPVTHVGRIAQATNTVAPATRRQVWLRDKGRCVVPGCRHHVYLDLHHLELRSEGGEHTLANLVLLCNAHHTAVHEGRLLIRGTPSAGLEFHHASGRGYAQAMPKVEANQSSEFVLAFKTLRTWGFREGPVKAAIDEIRTHVGMDANVETIIRAALPLLVDR